MWYYIEKRGGSDMRISITKNQRIGIYQNNILIAYFDDRGIPIITPKFFGLSQKEIKCFWDLVNKVR